jgi:Xaa-Pro aminopeptidase
VTQPLSNRARAARLMAESGIEAVVACSPASVRYLTGYWCWLAPLFKHYMVAPGGSDDLVVRNVALLPQQGPECLIVEPYWALDARESWVEDVRLAGGASFAPATAAGELPDDLAGVAAALAAAGPGDLITTLAAALSDRGLTRARIGIERGAFRHEELVELARLLPNVELLDCTSLLRIVRAVKTAPEIALLAEAAEIAERAALAAFAEAGEGVTVSALARAFRARSAADGADFDHFAVSIRGLGFLCESERRLAAGSALYVDFGCIYRGWFSDSGTTLCVGEPSAGAPADFAAVRDAVSAGAAAMAPGVRGSAVQAAMQAALAERGVGSGDSYPHGHGVGLEVRDYPVLTPDSGAVIGDDCVELSADLALEPGMVVNLEAPVLRLGERSVHCERTFVVTEDGCRGLIAQDRSAPVVLGGRA